MLDSSWAMVALVATWLEGAVSSVDGVGGAEGTV